MQHQRHASPPSDYGISKGKYTKKLNHFLQALPHLDLTDAGLANVSGRFGLTVEQLQEKIRQFEASQKGGRDE